jgi:hypothetical protein
MEEQIKKSKHGCLRWGCGVPMIVSALAMVGMTVTIFVMEKRQEVRMAKRDKPETYSETFNTNFPPDYTVSAAEEEKFNKKMVDVFQTLENNPADFNVDLVESGNANLLRPLKLDEQIAKNMADMKLLKDYYPEGYYLVIHSVLKMTEKQQIVQYFYSLFSNNEDRVDFIVHELSHYSRVVNCSSSGYVLEDKNVIIARQAEMPKGDELLKYISEPIYFDNEYLKKNKHDIYTTLDEVVSYTKSTRVARALARYNKSVIDEDAPQSLSRQLFYLALHLKNIKENHPNLWTTLKKEKGFVYILSRMISVAKTEIQAAKDEGVSGFTGDSKHASSIDDNLAVFNENQALFYELYTATGIDKLGSLKDLSKQQLAKIGIKIER